MAKLIIHSFFICLISLLAIEALFPVTKVKAGELERQIALEDLSLIETRVYIGNNGSIGMFGNTYMEESAHPSILYRLGDAKAKNDNSLIGSTDELINELSILQQSTGDLSANDNDYQILQDNYAFADRVDILIGKMYHVLDLLDYCAINNPEQRDEVISKCGLVIDNLLELLDKFPSTEPVI